MGEDARSAQRLREFMQVFTPEGALQAAFERQAENKSLSNQLQLGCITPVIPLQKFVPTEDVSTTPAPLALNRPSRDDPPNTRHVPSAPDALPDFDVF